MISEKSSVLVEHREGKAVDRIALNDAHIAADKRNDLSLGRYAARAYLLMIVGKKALPAKDLKEFVAWLKANPDQATQGTTGAGGISTVGGLFFQRETGTRFRFVPYRVGLAAAMQDLVAGQIDFMIDTAANSLPQVRAGTIKAFAVTSKTRLSAAPDIPTVDEAGLPGLYALNWQAAFLPKGAPKDVVAKLNAALNGPVSSGQSVD